MAITTKNNTILGKHLDDGGYFGACKVTATISDSIIPVEFDPFWVEAGKDLSAIVDGGIKSIRESILIIEINGDEYAIFGLRDKNKNRLYPVQAPEFVAFYNSFTDAGCSILTKEQYQAILETAELSGF